MARQMKDSGIEWIGEIPETWEVRKLKNVADIIRGGSPRPIDAYLTDSDEGCNWIKIGDTQKGYKYIDRTKQKIIADGVAKSRIVHKGDLLLTNSMSFGEPYILNVDGCIHDGWVSFTNYKDISIDFLYYFLSSPLCFIQFQKQVDGGVVQNLNIDKVGSTIVFIPPTEEQHRIVAFLDRKCAEIDDVIERTKATIEEYKKLKQAVITEAVTKGVRGPRPMKDSGIEWIGEIPEKWSRDKVNRVFQIIGSGTTPKSDDESHYGGNINWIQSGDINGGILTTCKNTISEQTLAQYSALKFYHAPFIIIAMYGASVGNASIVEICGCVNQACCVLGMCRCNLQYAFYAFKVAKEYLIQKAVGGGQPNISQDTLRSLWLPIPSADEQEEIVAYLDEKCTALDTLIAKKAALLTELETYKKSLIYEYVTGKKEVTA